MKTFMYVNVMLWGAMAMISPWYLLPQGTALVCLIVMLVVDVIEATEKSK